jgi:hypothetical protein
MRSLVALVALAFALAAAPSSAQTTAESGKYLEMLRTDIKAATVTILTEVMELSDADGEKFWPIYREYDVERAKLGDRRVAMLKDYAANFDTLSNEKAKTMSDAYFKLKDDELALAKNYFKKVEKELGSNTAARFTQVMNQVNLLIDVQTAANIPLIGKYTETVQEAAR